jgi:uncharacterized protein (TIGR03437 family)
VERHGVQLVLSGHEHGYERSHALSGNAPADSPSSSTLYVITGGGGGALEAVGALPQCALSVEAFNYLRVDVEQDQLRLRAIGLDGEEIDSVMLGHSPALSLGHVMSTGGYTPAVAAGSLISITGQNLAPHTVAGSSQPGPGGLGGVLVLADDAVAPLLSVSPTEINAQLPYDVSGPIVVRVLTPNGSVSANVTVLPAAPSLLAVRSGKGPLHFCNPVRPGAVASLYLTGIGALEKQAPSASPLALPGLEVWFGNTRLNPSFASAQPGRPGVCRIDVVIPPHLSDGLYALRIVASGVSSRPANVDVAATASRARNDRARMRAEVPSTP